MDKQHFDTASAMFRGGFQQGRECGGCGGVKAAAEGEGRRGSSHPGVGTGRNGIDLFSLMGECNCFLCV